MRRSYSRSRRTRDAFVVSNQGLRFSSPFSRTTYTSLPRLSIAPIRRHIPLTEYEDRRTWHPEGVSAPARRFSTTRHRLVTRDRTYKSSLLRFGLRTFTPFPRLYSQTKAAIAFFDPSRTLICVRRKIRREVMHALGFSGSGGGSQRSARWSENSSVRCS